MVAVVEQADVPARTHLVEEIHQGAGTLGKLEAIDQFVLHLRRMAADQVADVQLGHFVVGQIQRRIAVLLQLLDELGRLAAIGHLHADEHMCLGSIVKR